MTLETSASPPVIDAGRPQMLNPAICRVWQWSSILSWSGFALVMGLLGIAIARKHFDTLWWVPTIGPAVSIAGAMFSWWMAKKQFDAWTYQLNERELILSHGVFWRSRRTVPRGRVQHIDVNSGPLDRKFGLVQVCVYVAGAMGSIGAIPGLTPERADELRAAIIEGRDLHA